MNRLDTDIYDYLKKQNKPIQFGDLCRCSEFSSKEKREISTSLRRLGSNHIVYRYIENGKAYYTLDKAKGEDVNPSRKYVSDFASIFGGTVNDEDTSDVVYSKEAFNADNLFNDIDEETEDSTDIVKTDLSQMNILPLTYKNGTVFNGKHYSIKIPDGFVLETNVKDGDNIRDFIAWLPGKENPNDRYSSLISIFGSHETEFDSANNKNLNLLNQETMNSLFFFEQIVSYRESLNLGAGLAFADDLFEQPLMNGYGYCTAMYSDAYYFYTYIPAYDKKKMIRIDVNENSVDSEIDAKKIACEIMKGVSVEFKLEKYDALDSSYFTEGEFTKKKEDKFLEIVNRCINEGNFITNNILSKIFSKTIEIYILMDMFDNNKQSIAKEGKIIAKKWLKFKTDIYTRLFEQIKNFFNIITNKETLNYYILDLREQIIPLINNLGQVIITIDGNFDGEVSIQINNYEDMINSMNSEFIKSKLADKEKLAKAAFDAMSQEEKDAIKAKEIEAKIVQKNNEILKKYPKTSKGDAKIIKEIAKKQSTIKLYENKMHRAEYAFYSCMSDGINYRVYSSVLDPRSKNLVDEFKTSINDQRNRLENDVIYVESILNNIKNKGGSEKLCEECIEYLEWLISRCDTYTFYMYGTEVVRIPASECVTHLPEWKDYLNNFPSKKVVDLEKEEKIASKQLNEQIKKCKKQIDDNKKRIKIIKENFANHDNAREKIVNDITFKKDNLDKNKEEICSKYSIEFERINSCITDTLNKINEVENDIKKLENELSNTFALNFKKKKELNNNIEDSKNKVKNLKDELNSLNDDLKKQENLQNKDIQKLFDEIASLEKELDTFDNNHEKEKEELELLNDNLPKKSEDLNKLNKIKDNFNSSWIIYYFDDNGNKKHLKNEDQKELEEKEKPKKGLTLAQKANVNFKDIILNTLSDKPITISTLQSNEPILADLSNQRISALLTQLMDEGKVERTFKERNSYFTVKK